MTIMIMSIDLLQIKHIMLAYKGDTGFLYQGTYGSFQEGLWKIHGGLLK